MMNRIENAKNGEDSFKRYRKKRQLHWDRVAQQLSTWRGWGGYYHQRLAEIYRHLVAPDQSVLEIGCGEGDLLAALMPSFGVGVDLSYEMIKRAKRKHPDLRFVNAEAHYLCLKKKFDVVILSDLLNDLWDVQAVFEMIRQVVHRRTRIIINSYSRVWELPLALGQKLNVAKPNLPQNWLTIEDIKNLLMLADFETINWWEEILLPIRIPLLSSFFNRYLVKLWPFQYLGLTNFLVARPCFRGVLSEPMVSVIIPARNESGNILDIFVRTPEMGRATELIFIEGHSLDDTYNTIQEAITKHPGRKSKLFQQKGEGKGDAVRLGFEKAEGDVLMILDADLSVPPEDLTRFYKALHEGKGEFVNGVRLTYPMEDKAMQFLNLVGNRFFSLAFSWILGQPIKDTLCGTKVLNKRDYDLISSNRAYFGDFDPFGDFDLLFGAAKEHLKIVEVPVRYHARSYGETNIDRWKHGWLLFRMLVFALRRIKFF